MRVRARNTAIKVSKQQQVLILTADNATKLVQQKLLFSAIIIIYGATLQHA
jgi:hypothetical protein